MSRKTYFEVPAQANVRPIGSVRNKGLGTDLKIFRSANNNLRREVAYKLREKLQPQSELGLYNVIIEGGHRIFDLPFGAFCV